MRSKYEPELQTIFTVQRRIQDLHPFLNLLFPVAIREENQFLIFEVDATGESYRLVKKADVDLALPNRVRAAFPLTCHDDKMSCVVTPDIFADETGYIAIFHEFIHCCQFTNGEQQLKQTLSVAQAAMTKQDYMWELNHPFPYGDETFVETYRAFLLAAAQHDTEQSLRHRHRLQQWVAQHDYEYMVWQEWKEGFARFIENIDSQIIFRRGTIYRASTKDYANTNLFLNIYRIRLRLGFAEHHGGAQPPFTRVTFYAGGARYIALLGKQKPILLENIHLLFQQMMNATL